jgi:prevent-host-death family protein
MPSRSRTTPRKPVSQSDTWTLQDAKARLSEVLRRSRTDGPQRVTVHGREEAVILSVDAFRRLLGGQTGPALVDALQACPHPDFDMALESQRTAARDVVL